MPSTRKIVIELRSAEIGVEDFENGKRPPTREYHYTISVDSTGFFVKRPVGSDIVIRWSDVRRVVAFKRDEYYVDCLCFWFECMDGTTIQLDEDLADWRPLLESLPHHLPGCRPLSSWFKELPPFAPNQTVLFDRGNEAPNSAIPSEESKSFD